MAQNTQKASTRTPKMNAGRRRSSRHRSLRAWPRSERFWASGPRAWIAVVSGSVVLMSPRSLETCARVHPGQDEIGAQCGKHVDDRDDEHAADQHRRVLGRGAGDRQTQSRIVEDLLDHDEAAEHVTDLDTDHGHRRLEAVAEHVM